MDRNWLNKQILETDQFKMYPFCCSENSRSWTRVYSKLGTNTDTTAMKEITEENIALKTEMEIYNVKYAALLAGNR